METLDPEIKDLVMDLIANGFNTFSSCSGKKGHAFNRPTIRLELHKTERADLLRDERRRLRDFLQSRGYKYYQIKEIYDEQTCFIELEFIGLNSLHEIIITDEKNNVVCGVLSRQE